MGSGGWGGGFITLTPCVPRYAYQRDGARVPAATLELLGRALEDGVLKCGT